MSEILEMKGISKSFGVPVLKNVDFGLEEGEITALVGGNGAGKSTLMKIMTGVYTKDSGSIHINGNECKIDNIQDAKNNGIAMIFQEFSLVPTMTISENIFLGEEIMHGKRRDVAAMHERAIELLARLGLDVNPDETISDLSVGMCQMVEIAKALSKEARILVFDEPTASLSESEINHLFNVMKKLKKNGISMVYISHRMNEILEISDVVTVLRDGEIVMHEKAKELSLYDIIYAIMGRSNSGFNWQEREYDSSNTLLQVDHLAINRKINDISFNLKSGEIIGFAGLMGSGRTEILETLFGIRKKLGGKITISGEETEIFSSVDAVREGLALIPEDRREQGLVGIHSVKENAILPGIDNYKKKRFLIDEKKANKVVESNIKEMKIVVDDKDKQINLLSGGNQQKVVIAKWMNTNPRIMMLDEPTSGIDIGAKTEIIQLMKSFADEGNGVIFVSSELSELMSVCDQIYVLHNGMITKKYNRKEIDNEEMLQHAIQKAI